MDASLDTKEVTTLGSPQALTPSIKKTKRHHKTSGNAQNVHTSIDYSNTNITTLHATIACMLYKHARKNNRNKQANIKMR